MKLNANTALNAGLECLAKFSGENIDKLTLEKTSKEFKELFEQDIDFRKKIKLMDALIDNTNYLHSVREFCFDLLLVDFIGKASDKFGDEFLESAEWSKIEDETIDRGTELLNVLLYLKECELEKIEPSLEDFLIEFLLVEEEEFQEEHGIYEDIISNQMLMESDYSEIERVYQNISDHSEIKDIFYPLMCFFLNTKFEEKNFEKMVALSNQKNADSFIVGALMAYKA